MNPHSSSIHFEEQFSALREVAEESNRRLLQEVPDALFENHSNVFIKSYLVSACSVLEAFLQNEVLYFVHEIKGRVFSANIPHNLTTWSAGAKESSANRKFSPFEIDLTDKEVTEKVSGNIEKTINSFASVGVDLTGDDEFRALKDFISARVTKRNSIIHDNDDASDVSFSDVIELVDKFTEYCRCIQRIVRNNSHLRC
ncbi:HEPN domain-containing protein [Ruegeria halocynthiae]|uniref:HEPN domain-containing protein n=1 Tax=Ruegeria halocynthiae TaxID=985054 RepID=UPI00056459E7|nr:HEPN domain-containing protein [Ruegeria halocynthiae]